MADPLPNRSRGVFGMTLFKIFYAPAYFTGFVTAAISIVTAGYSPLWLIPLLLAAVAVSLIAERLAPFEPEWNHAQGEAARDIAHAVVNEVSILGLMLLFPLIASLVPWPSLWPSGSPLWLQILIALLMLDAGITLAHFASHRVSLLWRFHAVHHSVQRMYGFNGLMKHPVHQLIEISAGALPWLLLGLPSNIAAICSFAVAIQLQLQHSNVDIRVGPLARIWAIAPVHRHHHVATSKEGDVNFGLFFTIWDVLLGTAWFVGSGHVRSGMLGIENRPDYPKRYLMQLAEPFRAPQIAAE